MHTVRSVRMDACTSAVVTNNRQPSKTQGRHNSQQLHTPPAVTEKGHKVERTVAYPSKMTLHQPCGNGSAKPSAHIYAAERIWPRWRASLRPAGALLAASFLLPLLAAAAAALVALPAGAAAALGAVSKLGGAERAGPEVIR